MKKKIMLYGAGFVAQKMFSDIVEKYDPVCFIDRDPKKQGQCFCGLPVLPLAEAMKRYPELDILITSSFYAKFDIINQLYSEGIPAERIIGEKGPIEQRWGCCYLEQLISFLSLLIALSLFLADIQQRDGRLINLQDVLGVKRTHYPALNQMLRSAVDIRAAI